MRAFYGENGDSRFRDVLNGTVKPPQAAHQFLASIRQDFHEGRRQPVTAVQEGKSQRR